MKNSFSSCRYNGIAMRHEADVFFNEIHPNTALLSADCVCGSGDMSLLLTVRQLVCFKCQMAF